MTENDVSEKNIERLIHSGGAELHMPAPGRTQIMQRLTGKTAQEQKSIPRIIMKSKITKLAAAAVITTAVLVGLYLFGGSIDPAARAFGQVTQAVENMPWVAVSGTSQVTPNSLKVFISPRHQIRAVITQEGRVFWSDFLKRQRKVYEPQDNTLTISYEYDSGGFDIEDESPWSYLSLMIAPELWEGAAVTRRSETVQGRQTDVYEITRSEPQGTVYFIVRADPLDHLPITITVKAVSADGHTAEFIKFCCDYPQQGPADVYELGVPRDAKVIDELPRPGAEELLEICRKYRSNFTSYVIIVMLESGSRIRQIDISYINGDTFKAGRYYKAIGYCYTFEGKDEIRLSEKIAEGFDSLLDWIRSENEMMLMSVDLWDGEYSHWMTRNEQPSYRKSRNIGSRRDIYGYAWPYAQPAGAIIEDEYSSENNYVCLRAHGSRFYFDPEHDYVCMRREYLQDHDDADQRHNLIRQVTQLAQTEEGWWYPGKMSLIRVNKDAEGKEISREVTCVDNIYVKIVSEFPAGIFDAKNLPRVID
ncbi:MAG: hypothetical protein ACYS4W_04440 [Planctomycetota bacterium]|jgi:hypothetical protein